MSDIFQRSIARHREVLQETEAVCEPAIIALAEVVTKALQEGKRVYFFGNGGSAADAQHMATELSVRFIKNRRALAGMALTTDSSVLTACGNDLGFEQIFARQIEALGQAGDVAIGISTSGNSPNVIAGLKAARSNEMVAAGMAGNSGGRLKGLAEPLVVVPSNETALVQEMHVLLGHVLCAEIEERLGFGDGIRQG